ncbi:glycosyltransferase family 2 protein [Allostreptomyces psammosilenae]|uniref:GT2 family glycosyltransferase n=1 Tax=Allostreptomyces psammosilenae TaxID=1892865 RepID=A0A852ZZQ6_9ACTN|nr:glycosyltransferase family 2 protein [Allostreptomyces psammosilenae]NYI07595.1 GT2 family glycosyltransferase [Allostreptomyces psammosilenae]
MSVVVPARDAAATLGRQLDALARQRYAGPWEVIVVDNGSRDATPAVVAARLPHMPGLRLVRAPGPPGVNRARNTGCRHARGELFLFCDADDVVTPGWIDAMARALRHAPAVGGALERVSLNGPVALAARPPKPRAELSRTFDFLPYPLGANCGVRAELWARLGGFDESYTYGCDDVEFFWRAQLAGDALGFAPDAVVHYQLRPTLRGAVRQSYRYGRSHPVLYRAFRAAGMPASPPRTVRAEWWWLLSHAADPLRAAERRAAWLARAALRCGRLVGSLRCRVLYL